MDSTDIERLQTASEELSAMLNEEELKDAALLVFANKQDQPGAKGAGEISEALRLGELRDRNWSIMACSAVDGSGVNEGMDWLVVSFSLRFSKGQYTDAYLSKPSTKTKPGPPMTIFPCASVWHLYNRRHEMIATTTTTTSRFQWHLGRQRIRREEMMTRRHRKGARIPERREEGKGGGYMIVQLF